MSDRSPLQLLPSRSYDEARGFLIDTLSTVYAPRPIPPIEDWLIEQNLEITSDQNTSYKGEIFDPRRCPVVSRLAFKFFETPNVHELFVMKPVQSTFTTHVFFAVAHMLIFRPRTGIMAMHTRQEMRKKKKDTFEPVVKKIDGLMVPGAKDETTAEEFRFAGSNLYVGGGQTNAVLTSTPAGVVILDECEQHGVVDDTTTIALARGRITAQDEWRKICGFSKPLKEAQFKRDTKTGNLDYIPQDGTYMHAEYLSGNQLRYECPCPKCGVFTEPNFRQIRFDHCAEQLVDNEGKSFGKPIFNKDRVLRETYWKCPHCDEGKVHGGAEKRAWVLAGRWVETPLAQRKAREMYPRGHPQRWSAQFSALTDIAFDSLKWGAIALRFLDAKGDPVKLTAFNNEILGIPEPSTRTEETTHEQLRRLIPGPKWQDPPPWRMREGDKLTGIIPLLRHKVSYVQMTCDNQKETVKYRVRAYGNDGRSYLLDYGEFPAKPGFPELRQYFATQQFTTIDGHSSRIMRCYIDINGRWYDSIDLCIAEYPNIVGTVGSKPNVQTTDRVWAQKVNAKSGTGLYVWFFDSNFWEGRLYRDTIQHFDPRRHRPYAPAMYFANDTGDEYLAELMQMHEVLKNGKNIWEKVSQHGVNDFGDCEKIGLIADYLIRGKHDPGGTEVEMPDPDAEPDPHAMAGPLPFDVPG